MLPNTFPHVSGVDDQASLYLARIRQIDKILEGPVRTLIGLTQLQEKGNGGTAPKKKIYFPTWISSELTPEKNEDNRLTQAICCGTLQQIWRFSRRFAWLDKDTSEQFIAIRNDLVNAFTPERPNDFEECAQLLNSQTFGGLNPLTASQLFRVLLEEGEGSAHSGIGFLAFFAMVWPLSRTFPVRLTAGARIEPWDVTAYVTAKCLLPIRRLQGIIERRANLYEAVENNLAELKKKKNASNPRDRWLFKIELDTLSANLSLLSRYAINKDAFSACAKSIKVLSDSEDLEDQIYTEVLDRVSEALVAIKTTSKKVLDDANKIVKCLDTWIVAPLRAKQHELNDQNVYKRVAKAKPATTLSFIKERLGLRFANEHAENKDYWEDLANAAETSIKYCNEALKELEAACDIQPEKRVRKGAASASLEERITSALKALGNANRKVKDVLNKPVTDAALWCRSVVDREIAHASAENFTDFDPSELVSGIAVAVGWDLMSTKLQVSDAVTKALAGARKDGSWRTGKPFYSQNYATGIWAMTSDLVWTLTSAIKKFPDVSEADIELFNFVDWLERTRISLPVRSSRTDQSEVSTGPAKQQKSLLRNYVGWPSERLRDRSKIQLGTTALSINALLEIRNLTEYRLWELCKKRFAVLSIEKPLREIEPVDLGTTHSKRLHRQLEEMAYRARINHSDAVYSLILHGPPGSSKTKLAEALSAEMWKFSSRWGPSEPRFIRITPADFTRMGEDRLDSEARAIFDLLSGVRGVTIFFDEIDDLLRQRNAGKERPTFMELVVPAMLNRLADLRSACPRQEISFVLATNYVDNIDAALIRKGRIDESIPVVYPDFLSRVAISIGEAQKRLEKEKSKERETRKKEIGNLLAPLRRHEEVASKTKGWPYLAITSLCGFVLRQLLKDETDFATALDKGLAEYGTSFSPPLYDGRLRDQSQEFLNEYTHHLISQPKDPGDCYDYLATQIRQLKIDAPLAFKLNKLLDTVLIKEGRRNGGSKT